MVCLTKWLNEQLFIFECIDIVARPGIVLATHWQTILLLMWNDSVPLAVYIASEEHFLLVL